MQLTSNSLKVQRALWHANALAGSYKAWKDQSPPPIELRVDKTAEGWDVVVARLSPLPLEVQLQVGDCIQNLRSALDHVAHALTAHDTGTPFQKSQFPIADDQLGYNDRRVKDLRGASPAAVAAIDQIAPYRSGDKTLWQLHKLNNIDKHRVLLPMATADMSPGAAVEVYKEIRDSNPDLYRSLFGQARYWVPPPRYQEPLAVGHVVNRFNNQVTAVGKVDAVPTYVVREAEADVDESFITLLPRLVTRVDQVLAQLAPLIPAPRP